MLCIDSTSDNPYFNLAAEEYLLRNFNEDIFLLYINEPCIVVGKHQNALSEINLDFVKQNNINVARRLSGGGAVFHDFGNLNFCFIQTVKDKNLVNFSKFVQPLIEVLQSLGLDALAGDKNDILIDGLKVSGNAEHIFKQRVLHHGTLLFNSNLDRLNEALKVNAGRFTDRSVQSRRSQVGNIRDFLTKPLSIEEFRKEIFKSLMANSKNARQYKFSKEDLRKITQLENEKFSTWDWNFGYSPDYDFRNSILSGMKHYEVVLRVEKGLIRKVDFLINNKEDESFRNLEAGLINRRHDPADIKACLDSMGEEGVGIPISFGEIVRMLF